MDVVFGNAGIFFKIFFAAEDAEGIRGSWK